MKGVTFEQVLAGEGPKPKQWTCEEHGAYGEEVEPFMSYSWSCVICGELASRAINEFNGDWGRYRWWRSNSGVPLRNRCAVLSHLSASTASGKVLAKAISAYLGNFDERVASGEGGILLGPPGLGKTLALSVLINSACQLSSNARYVTWPDTLADLKAGFSGSRDDERRHSVSSLKDVRLLAIDELGVKASSDFDYSELFGLIDYRYRNRKPTWVAANTTLDAFAAAVGERVADRLQEMGPVIALTGESLRGKTAISGPPAFPEPPQTLVTRVHYHGEWRERVTEAPDGYSR